MMKQLEKKGRQEKRVSFFFFSIHLAEARPATEMMLVVNTMGKKGIP